MDKTISFMDNLNFLIKNFEILISNFEKVVNILESVINTQMINTQKIEQLTKQLENRINETNQEGDF